MSLLPLFLNDNWYSVPPSHLWDQHFGLELDVEDSSSPLTIPSNIRAVMRCPVGYYRPLRSETAKTDADSITSTKDKDKFEVNLDVQQFAPEEICVRVRGTNNITVEGKHEEKQDEHGFIARHFVRRYVLPDGHDINRVASNLSLDGILSITAPPVNQSNVEFRTIPIQQTGTPMKAVRSAQKQGNGRAQN